MSAYALERIESALQLGAKSLDLGCCSIHGDLPTAILGLSSLETLILSDEDWDEASNQFIASQNQQQSNRITSLPKGLHKMKALRRIVAQDQPINWALYGDELPPQLEDLVINGCAVDSVEWLRNATELRRLDIGFCPIESLSGLEMLQKLARLRAYNTAIQDLLPFKAGFPQLIEVGLSGCNTASLDGIEGLSAVKSLDLSWTNISEIEALGQLLSLEHLSIAHTLASDLRPLANLKHLRTLDLAHCPVKDISPLLKLPELVRLDISNTLVTDIADLQTNGFHLANDRMSLNLEGKNVIVTGCTLAS